MFNSFIIRLQSLGNSTLNDVSKDIYNYFHELLKKDIKDSYFTVSNFFKNQRYNLELEKGKYYLFKISTLDVDDFSLFTSHLFKKKILNENINIGDSNFVVKEIICDESKSKYVTRFDNDRFRYINSEKCNIKEYKLQLITPTIFKVGSQFYSEINSEILFRNLLNKFNRFSGYTIDKQYIKEISKIKIITSELITNRVKMGKGFYEGIKCIIYINLENIDDKLKKIARTLVEFSVYSGVGHKSEFGFGQVIML
ncbi:CRISPR system precrRNA processing endoribonuclease RAMP protein Cas6 [Romboutsia maritimum]|uniref:CRISPR system precrRNA processing endoribonuclease RAMP protein Cas6 n=1 Tax=Romboutsia maritimum TaxID=2020948 RepID=A0A371ITI7_9FIRM|nr:CRISPR system precrRNA processing endoribonuclease RAMP protein Cas6 [Romboutsia maritimum]RDY23790.1 CRISPR system precrRNA processing endoribonuclease RAMP protein Cas6 [Romboutsia maritimum]